MNPRSTPPLTIGRVALLSSALLFGACDHSNSAKPDRAEPSVSQSGDRWREYPKVIAPVLKNAITFDKEGAQTPLRQTRYTALVFMNSTCPLAAKYADALSEMRCDFHDNPEAEIVGVFSQQGETKASITEYAKKYDAEFPLLLDTGHILADALHAERSPEVFLLDNDHKIIYRGAIDNTLRVRGSTPAGATHYLREVLTSIINDTPKPHTITDAEGCYIDRPGLIENGPTFTRDIGPLIDKNCTYCHRPGDVGGILSLTNFKQIQNSAHTLEERITEGYMPPWRPDPRYGKFKNNLALDVNEIWAFRKWVKHEAPHGNGEFSLKNAQSKDHYRLKNPDVILKMFDEGSKQQFYHIPAKTPDNAPLPYQHFTIQTDFGEDKWLRASEVRTLAPSVTHHVNIFVIPPKEYLILENKFVNNIAKAIAFKKFGVDREEFDEVFRIYGPGMRRQLFVIGNYTPNHTALEFSEEHPAFIPRGSEIRFECHYTPNGIAAKDCISLALKFASPDTVRVQGMQSITRSGSPRLGDINIPPGQVKTASRTLEFFADAEVSSLRPHMHLRGFDFKAYRELPGKAPELILYLPTWDYEWQMVYYFEKPVDFPAGSKLRFVYQWDNTTNNPNNPDATQTVRFGTKISAEMGMAWATYAYKNPGDVVEAERKLEGAMIDSDNE